MEKKPSDFNDDCGIQATGNLFGESFFFYTEDQQSVENAMNLMGYGSRDYNLKFFKGRPMPEDVIERFNR